MNRSARIYVIVLFAVVFLMATALPRADLLSLGPRAFFGLTVFAALALLAEAMAVEFSVASKKSATSSISFLPLFAAVAIFPPLASLITASVVTAANEFLLHRRSLAVRLFNVAQLTISFTSASLAYHLVSGSTVSQEISLAGFAALAGTFFLANLCLVALFFALRQQLRFIEIFRKVIGPAGGNLFYDLLATPIAILAAYLYTQLYITGIVIMVLPLLLVRYSYVSKIQLERANKDLVRILIKAIETRDPYTSGHSMRVSTLSREIAIDLGLPRRKVDRVETAALLHDIGKIETLYATVISKPYDLTESERALIRTHATKGADLLESLSAFGPDIISCVRHHHERFDGNGYPDGLAGTEIPLGARVIMLCDSIDAMLSDRPYRSALSIEHTHNELIRCSGTQFDPEIVEVILRKDTLRRAAGLLHRPEREEFTAALSAG